MTFRSAFALLALWAGLAFSGQAWADITVSAVRFGSDGERTRMVIDISSLTQVSARILPSPPRLVVDLPAVNWRLQDNPQSRPRGLAKAFRFGAVDSARARLVVDLAAMARITGRQDIPPGQDGVAYGRHVIDLVADANAPATAAPEKAKPAAPEGQPQQTVIAVTPPIPRPSRPAISAAPSEVITKPVIAIDAGHGGVDPGAIAKDGTPEKTIVLSMARELADILEKSGRYQPFLVRKDDSFIKLRDRIARARQANADVFISIHADSISDRNLRGSSIYTLSEKASDKEAASLAAKENKADIIGGTDLSRADEVLTSILIDLSQRSTNNESIKFADHLVDEIGKVANLVGNTRRFAGFAVLKAPDMPSVLVELGYLSNAEDAGQLAQKRHRARLGASILRALDLYFEETNDG